MSTRVRPSERRRWERTRATALSPQTGRSSSLLFDEVDARTRADVGRVADLRLECRWNGCPDPLTAVRQELTGVGLDRGQTVVRDDEDLWGQELALAGTGAVQLV